MSSISTAALWAQKKEDVMPTTPSPPFSEERSKLKITGVRMVHPRPRRPLPTYKPAPGSWSTGNVEVANPMSIYPEYKARRSLFMAPDLGPSAVEITTDKGVQGIGYGGPGAGFVIEKHLAQLLIDEDPFNLERLWDIMWRSTLYYGRKGMVVHAISAVDNALWDLVGNALKMPVYQLLGGETKSRIPSYCTGNDLEQHIEFGYTKLKLAVPYGPADGLQGMKKNVELVERARKLLGPSGEIMLDCWMALTETLHARIRRSPGALPCVLDGGVLATRQLRWLWTPQCSNQFDTDGHRGTRVHTLRLPIASGMPGGRHLAAGYELVWGADRIASNRSPGCDPRHSRYSSRWLAWRWSPLHHGHAQQPLVRDVPAPTRWP